MPFAAALSEHPVAAHAVGEVAGELLERLGPSPTWLPCSSPHPTPVHWRTWPPPSFGSSNRVC